MSYIGSEKITSCVDAAGVYLSTNQNQKRRKAMTYEEMYKKAEQSKELQNLTPVFKEFRKKGERIVGKLVSYIDTDSSAGEGTYKQYLFETDEGLVKFALGAATDKEIVPLMNFGKIYAIEFLETIKISGGRNVNKFKVQQITPDDNKVGGENDRLPF